MGNAVDPANVDAIAFQETDSRTVLVYRCAPADAEPLVRGLVAAGESNAALLDANAWLVTQAATCPGRQKCKRIKRLGKDVCACML